MGKGTALCSITIDRDRLMRQGLLHKARKYHSITPSLAWPHGIKKTHDDHRQLLRAVVGKSGELINQFGGCVTPAGFGGRAIYAVVCLLQRGMILHAVDL